MKSKTSVGICVTAIFQQQTLAFFFFLAAFCLFYWLQNQNTEKFADSKKLFFSYLEEMHAEICYAECLLQKAALTFVQVQSVIYFMSVWQFNVKMLVVVKRNFHNRSGI